MAVESAPKISDQADPTRTFRQFFQQLGRASLLLPLGVIALVSPAIPLATHWLPVYDERRVMLVVLLCLASLIVCLRRPAVFATPVLAPFLVVGAIGLFGMVAIAAVPAYAALELALFVTMISAVLLAGNWPTNEYFFRKILLAVFGGSAVFYGIVTLMVLAAGWAYEGHRPPWPEPLHNFINRRFMNDWQTWLLPFLPAVLYAQVPRCRDSLHRALSIVYFGFLWALLLYTLGRATLYAQLGCLVMMPLLFGRRGLKWSGIQIGVALIGLFLLIFALGMNPFAADSPTERLISLESPGRYELWQISLQLIREHPLLGVGPMQFAALPQVNFAHPHNFVLQVAVEWGIPAALLFFGALLWSALHWLGFVRQRLAAPDCPNWEAYLLMSLTGSMAAAAANSLAAGTAHTPMSQIMLILVVGCAYALYHQHSPPPPHKWQKLSRLWLAATVAAALWLGGFTSYELVHYLGNELEGTEYIDGGWKPRFWRVGKLQIEPD